MSKYDDLATQEELQRLRDEGARSNRAAHRLFRRWALKDALLIFLVGSTGVLLASLWRWLF